MRRGFLRQESASLGGTLQPVLLPTSRGKEAMKRRERILLSPPLSQGRPSGEEKGGIAREEIFEELRKLRSLLARGENLPPYSIFQDRTLKEMARQLPDTPEKMKAIVGVGEITFRKYGKDFLDLIISRTGAKESASVEVRQ